MAWVLLERRFRRAEARAKGAEILVAGPAGAT